MAERVLQGAAASPGMAAGPARVLDAPARISRTLPVAEREREAAAIHPALERAASEVERVASSLRSAGRSAEADIVETGVLMARDPGLGAAAAAAVLERGLPAAQALTEAAELHARAVADLGDATLAARADDIRSIGRRAARSVPDGSRNGGSAVARRGREVIVVARDLGPADVSELGGEVGGIVLAAGAVTAHAAIVARSLGIPMVVGVGEAILAVAAGAALVIDGDEGSAVIAPAPGRLEAAHAAVAVREAHKRRSRTQRDLPAITRDGRRVQVLANAATPTEIAVALDAGAEGAGLIRTELAFLDAPGWPTEEQHVAALEPVLAALGGRSATVRVLDFGADKTPPFLEGTQARGLELLLARPDALSAQLRAIVRAGANTRLRLLLPMVESVAQVRATRELLREALNAVEPSGAPLLGAMVELPVAATRADELVAEVDFISIGTNDLAASTLGADRFAAGATPAHDPRVLALIARTLRAATAAGVPAEVCGEAASDPICVPLLVGLGADELSVGAARVGTVRSWLRVLKFTSAAALAERALRQPDAEAVARLAEPLALRAGARERAVSTQALS